MKIVLFFIFVNFILCETCDPSHGSEGVYDCVRIPKYNGYQWAVCLSTKSLKKHMAGHMGCQGSSFCWLPCTQSVYPEIREGHIAKECVCDSVENERRKRSLALQGREEEYNSLSDDGKSWVRSSQKCIEDRMRSVLIPNNTEDCRNIRDRAYQVHSDCYFQSSKAKFCNLLGTDQQKIYWSIKQVYEHAFSEKFDKSMAKFRSCLRNDVFGHQRKFMFYVQKDLDENINENEFALSLATKFEFSSHGIDWDVDKTAYSRKRRDVKKHKRYEIVGIFVSRKEVDFVKRPRRGTNQPCLRKTQDNEYDEKFLESFNKSITNVLKNDALEVPDKGTPLWKKIVHVIGLLAVTHGSVILCFPSKYYFDASVAFGCIVSSLLIHSYRKGILPDTPEDINTRFFLNTVGVTDLQLKFSSISGLRDFNPSKKTFIIIHGFLSSGQTDWISNMRRQILSTVDANVIVVDWEKGADISTLYYYAAVNTEVVGTILALLVRSLEHHHGADKSHFHIIGHSLGAHVAGFSGSAYKKTRYQRITGLDPAGPFFRTIGSDARLDKTDAHFVDVIHTDGGSTGSTGLGYLNAMGHLDFYPNGGQSQPGCLFDCSHSRAYEYFTESILSNETFRAWECQTLDQCTELEGIDTSQPPENWMGFHVDDSKRNKMYYLKTNRKAPFNIPP